jgi:ketosteroid isomerase-like protein
MIAKGRARILVGLAIIGIAVVPISYAQAPIDSDKAEVMALNQRLIAGFNKKDVGAVMVCYSDDPNAIFFDETIPFQFNKVELAKGIAMFFQSVTDYHIDMESVDVLASGDLAVVYSTVRKTWTDKSGKHSQTSRYTQVDRKEGGKWLI